MTNVNCKERIYKCKIIFIRYSAVDVNNLY